MKTSAILNGRKIRLRIQKRVVLVLATVYKLVKCETSHPLPSSSYCTFKPVNFKLPPLYNILFFFPKFFVQSRLSYSYTADSSSSSTRTSTSTYLRRPTKFAEPAQHSLRQQIQFHS